MSFPRKGGPLTCGVLLRQLIGTLLRPLLRVVVNPKPRPCPHCHGFGYCQVYTGRVHRVFCDCVFGDRRVMAHKEALREVGRNPEDPCYAWPRRSAYFLRGPHR